MKLADIMADMKGEMGQEWEKKGFQMPKFDIGALKARTHKAPVWVHFGAGNLFRAFPAAVLGNLIPAPFIIVYIRRIFELMRKYLPSLNGLVDKLEKKAHLKGQKVTKYKYLGLAVFVAIPLPGTGAWTGSLAAAFLDMPLRKALPSIFAGILVAGAAISVLTFGVASLF